jgi:hypothetical protein
VRGLPRTRRDGAALCLGIALDLLCLLRGYLARLIEAEGVATDRVMCRYPVKVTPFP